MSISIHPDPEARGGGFGFIAVPEGQLPEGPVPVAIMETYGHRWLAPSEAVGEAIGIGDANWQQERFDFGPYPLHRHEGCDWVRVGPEIVNKLEEYTPLRLHVGPVVQDITWPDDVPPRAGAAALGGVRSTAAAAPGPAPTPLRAIRNEDPPATDGAPPEAPKPVADPAPELPEVDPAPTGRRRLVVLALLAALVLAGSVAALLWLPEESDEAASPAPAFLSPDAPASQEACTRAALMASGDFAAQAEAARACGDSLSPDTLLSLIEDAAAREDATALLLFGMLYDAGWQDAAIEDRIGLSFGDDPAQAAEYYARAVAAGSPAAPDRLAAVCAVLARGATTLQEAAHDDYCN